MGLGRFRNVASRREKKMRKLSMMSRTKAVSCCLTQYYFATLALDATLNDCIRTHRNADMNLKVEFS
jgi:hypothetical protein